eukprot:GHVS01064516.1.p1 GENE.GHVS01064516.1~~GHVS01064516.1.p1  ORF type:complete len:289 (+),score=19.76 GHVS01064516.1:314-1180(+)
MTTESDGCGGNNVAMSQSVEQYVCREGARLVLQHMQNQLQVWRSRLHHGEVVPDFARHAESFLTQHMALYDRLTLLSAGSPIRTVMGRYLASRMFREIRSLFLRHVAILEKEARFELKRRLSDLLASSVKSGRPPSVDAQKTQLIEVARKLHSQCTDVVVKPSMGDELAALFNDILPTSVRNLEAFAREFMESPAAQLQIRRAGSDKKGTKSKSGPGKQRGLRVGLSLAAMLRQDGQGNLQGFANCDAGPVALTIGYANDRNAPESAINGQKPPYFRIQPKFNVDLSL